MSARCTSADNAEVRPTGAYLDGDNTTSNVCNERGNHEWRNATWAAFVELAALRLNRDHSTNSGTDKDAKSVGFERRSIFDTSIFQSKSGGSHGKLRVTVVAACLFWIHVLSRIKVQALRANFRWIIGGIERFHRIDAALTCKKVIPQCFDAVTVTSHGADTCYDDALSLNCFSHIDTYKKIKPH